MISILLPFLELQDHMPLHGQRLRLVTTTIFSKLQQFLARSLALSYSLNHRNIEHDWYAYWNHVILDMVKDIRNLVVSPQYVV